MEVKINREVRDYQENIFFGLNVRQLVFSLLAVGIAVGIYFGLKEAMGTETVSWLCILGAAPFGVLGFVQYNGMKAEQLAWAYVRTQWLMPKHLCFQGENVYYALLKDQVESRSIGKKRKGGDRDED